MTIPSMYHVCDVTRIYADQFKWMLWLSDQHNDLDTKILSYIKICKLLFNAPTIIILWIVILNTFHTENMHNNKFQVQLGQIVHVHPEIWYFMQNCVHIDIFVRTDSGVWFHRTGHATYLLWFYHINRFCQPQSLFQMYITSY